MSSLLFAQTPTDWQVEGLQGKVKHMHISKEYYWRNENGDTLYNPLPIFVDKYFDESGYLLYEEYNVVGPSTGLIMWNKILDYGGYEKNKKEESKASRYGTSIMFKGKKEWYSSTAYKIVLKSENWNGHKVVVEGKCNDKGYLLQRVETYYVNEKIDEYMNNSVCLEYNEKGELSSIEQDSNNTTFSIPIKKSEVQIVEKDNYGNPISIVYDQERVGTTVTLYQYEYY